MDLLRGCHEEGQTVVLVTHDVKVAAQAQRLITMRDGQIVVRRIGNVSVTFDHRVIDGKRAADFGLAVIARLER